VWRFLGAGLSHTRTHTHSLSLTHTHTLCAGAAAGYSGVAKAAAALAITTQGLDPVAALAVGDKAATAALKKRRDARQKKEEAEFAVWDKVQKELRERKQLGAGGSSSSGGGGGKTK
jgi:hypothetical protein